MADAIAQAANLEVGILKDALFPDGERELSLTTEVRDRDVVVLGGTTDDAATLFLYDVCCGVVHYGAQSLTLVLPYFGYSTMERAQVGLREVVMAKNRARLLSSIPAASLSNRVVMLDLHSEGLPHYFEGSIRPTHLRTDALMSDTLSALQRDVPLVVGSTDAGRAKWIQKIANAAEIEAAFVYKRRIDGARTEVSHVNAQVEGKDVVIYDDMVRTGGSLLGAARAYLDAGALDLSVLVTHGLFAKDSFARIRESGLFKRVIATDSHPRARALQSEGLEVISVVELIAQHLNRLYPSSPAASAKVGTCAKSQD